MTRRTLLSIAGGVAGASLTFGACDGGKTPPEVDGSLKDIKAEPFPAAGKTHDYYALGSGPAVVVLHELPGLTEDDIRAARRIAATGYRVYLPLMFGKAGDDRAFCNSIKVCQLNSEWECWEVEKPSRITNWLHEFYRHVSKENNNGPVGVVGMCLTGAFPLAAMRVEAVTAPVLCQPTMPVPTTLERKRHLGLPSAELKRAYERTDVPIMAMRFHDDWRCPPERIETLSQRFRGRLYLIDIPSSPQHKIDHRSHSVLGGSFMDCDHHPTRQALNDVFTFLNARLRTHTTPGPFEIAKPV
jgi:dienelactone hydrolase